MSDHTFVICAYKESPYLDECIRSLKKQTISSQIILSTSTLDAYINALALKYHIPVFVNKGEHGITQDWNFALSHVNTGYATIAHQDDIYEPEYTQIILEQIKKHKRPIIAFCDYSEIRNSEIVESTGMLRIKRLMLYPLKFRLLQNSRFVRRRILSFGDPICCPSVMYCLDNIRKPVFSHHFQCDQDWEAWEKLSKNRGSFVYIPQKLVKHRIHEDSTTSKVIDGSGRLSEDLEMFRRFWPERIAGMLAGHYSKAEEYNRLR